jgi:hypothetical protein
LTAAEWKRIAEASCRLVAYLHGFKVPLASSMVLVWHSKVYDAFLKGEGSIDAITTQHLGLKVYLQSIEEKYPGYILELYRYAIRTMGAGTTYKELAECMNAKSAAPGEDHSELNLSKSQVSKWFIQNGGKERSSKEKPLLTHEMKNNRLKWVKKYGKILTDPKANVAMLDKKWFYKHNRRRKLKDLPIMHGEDPEACRIKHPKATSRRFLVKIMYMGVVGRPRPEYNFDGKILLLRVSEKREMKQAATNERFVDDLTANNMLRKGFWQQYYTENMTIAELWAVVTESFVLQDDVADQLVFTYKTFYGKSGYQKTI